MASILNSLTNDEIDILLALPAGSAPSGVVSGNAALLRTGWIVYLVLTQVLLTCLLAIRLFSRHYLMKSLTIEDGTQNALIYSLPLDHLSYFTAVIAFVTFGWLASVAMMVLIGLGNRHGIGNHMWNITWGSFAEGCIYVVWVTWLFGIASMCTKIAVVRQHLRLFVPLRQVNRPMFNAGWIIIGITATSYLALLIYTPIMYRVGHEARSSRVAALLFISSKTTWRVAASVSIMGVLSDAAIILFPAPSICRLKLSLAKKLGILALFSTGLCALIVCVFRTYSVWNLTAADDLSWILGTSGFFMWADMMAGFYYFCLPSTPQFFGFLSGKMRAWKNGRPQIGRQGPVLPGSFSTHGTTDDSITGPLGAAWPETPTSVQGIEQPDYEKGPFPRVTADAYSRSELGQVEDEERTHGIRQMTV